MWPNGQHNMMTRCTTETFYPEAYVMKEAAVKRITTC